MIDRKALWISGLIFLAMTCVALWRLSLLPDWTQLPMTTPGGPRIVSGLMLFAPPLSLLLVVAILFARNLTRSGPEEAVARWRHWYGVLILGNAVMTGLAQAFFIARSLGALSAWNAHALTQVMMVAMGLLLAVMGNALPKMPFLAARFRPLRLDPFQWNRHLRFAGKLAVGMGLLIAVGVPLLPARMVQPTVIGMSLAMTVASFWHRARMRRQPSP